MTSLHALTTLSRRSSDSNTPYTVVYLITCFMRYFNKEEQETLSCDVSARTCSETEPDAGQEVVAGEAVVVPNAQLETALAQVLAADVIKHERVLPLRVTVLLHHGRLETHRLAFLWQQVAVVIKDTWACSAT